MSLFEQIINYAPGVIAAVVGFSLVVFIHELGHFLLAKRAGVRVHVFSIGMGKRLWGKKIGDTDYRIAMIPLGGYVQMAGQEDTPGAEELTGAEWEYPSKTVGQRMQIISAGVVFNFISSFAFLFLAAIIGITFKAPVVGDIQEGSPAQKAGLQSGERIETLNGEPVRSFEELAEKLVFHGTDTPVTLELSKDGSRRSVELTPARGASAPVPTIGIAPVQGARILAIAPTGVAALAGIKTDDVIVSVAGTPVTYWPEIQALFNENNGTPIEVVVRRKGSEIPFTVTPQPGFEVNGGFEFGTPAIISEVSDGYPAQRAGLQSGDKVVAIDSELVGSWAEMSAAIQARKEKPFTVRVERDGTQVVARVTPQIDPATSRSIIGISYNEKSLGARWLRFASRDDLSFASVLVTKVEEGSAAWEAGLRSGDRVVKVNSKAVSSLSEMSTALTKAYQKVGRSSAVPTVSLVYIRDGRNHNLSYVGRIEVPERFDAEGNEINPVGIGVICDYKSEIVQFGFGESLSYAMTEPLAILDRTYRTFFKLGTGELSPKLLGGPVMIFKYSYKKYLDGIGSLLWFLALLSINLAVINLLPIPVMDGGHLVLLAIEKLKGSPLSMKAQVAYQYVGVAFILVLLPFVMFNDIMREMGIAW